MIIKKNWYFKVNITQLILNENKKIKQNVHFAENLGKTSTNEDFKHGHKLKSFCDISNIRN